MKVNKCLITTRNDITMNYLNYTLRKVGDKTKLFDEYGNDLKETISPDETVFFTVWGVLKYTKNYAPSFPVNISAIKADCGRLWKEAPNAVVFEKNGLIGWKTPSGDLIMPPIFDQIEICSEYIYAHYTKRELIVYKGGTLSYGPDSSDKGRFYQNGKVGIKKHDGSILFPAIYDEIYRWSNDSDVFYTRIGNEFHYYNSNHEEILTTYRKFESVDDKFTPYYVTEETNRKTLVTMQITNDLNDSQSCVCFGQKVRLDRILKSEVADIIKSHCEVWSKGASCVDNFNSAFTYIYSAYYAQSNSSTPIEDCLKQFEQMHCYRTSWFLMVKIWTNRNTKIANADLCKLVWFFQDLENMMYSSTDPMNFVTIGYDDSLADGEVKMFQVNYFTDHWPDFELDNIVDDAMSGDIDNYEAKMQLLKEALKKEKVENNWTDDVYQSFYDEYFRNNAISDDYKDFDLKKEKELLDYLVDEKKYNVEETAFRICQTLQLDVDFGGILDNSVRVNRAYQKIKWALSHGSSLKPVIKKQSCLDLIRDSISKIEKSDEKGQKTKLQIFKKIERLLLKNGALTATEIRTESFDPYNLW